MKSLIYIADDEENIKELIKSFLVKEGYEVDAFSNGAQLLEKFIDKPSDMIILDIMMPGLDGFSLCTAIRLRSNVPIIMVSARDSEQDKINGINLGGDDYLTKPFSPVELVTRVKALFRRVEMDKHSTVINENLNIGNIIINTMEFWAKCNDINLELTRMELNLLSYMIKNKDRAVSRNELLNKVWGYECDIDTRVTDDTIKRLRKKLCACNSNVAVETIWGYGFKLTEIGGKNE